MSKRLALTIIQKLPGLIRSIFWKNKYIVYINSNVKNLNVEEIIPLITPSNSKYINCQSKKLNEVESLRKHYRKARINLYQILKNSRDSSKITYCGFASQMFSIYDGYILGDTLKTEFVDYNGKFYKIHSNIKHVSKSIDIDDSGEEIDIIISTSYDIDLSKCVDAPKYVFDEKAPNKITTQYLSKVYSFVKNVLDSCGKTKVKKVNLYITAKQSVSFIVGTAIQSYHPVVNVFEYRGNHFKYYLDLSKSEIIEVTK